MAEKKRTIELVLSGQMSGRLKSALKQAGAGLNRYKMHLAGVEAGQRKVRASSGMMGSGLLRSVAGYAAAYIGTQQLVSGMQSSIAEYNSQIAADNRLYQIMRNTTGATQMQIKAMKNLASQLQLNTVVGDDATEQGTATLAAYKLQYASLRKLAPAMQDMAVGTYGINVGQQQMEATAKLLGKAMSGQVGALRRQGLMMTKSQEQILKTGSESQRLAVVLDLVKSRYGGMATRMAQTPEGRVIQLKNAWGDIKEEIGAELTPVVSTLLRYLSKHLPQIRATILRVIAVIKNIAVALKPVAIALKGVGILVYDIGKWIVANWKNVGPIVMGIVGAILAWKTVVMAVTAAQWLLNAAMTANPIGLIVVGIGALIGLLYLLVKNWDKVVVALKRAWAWFVRFGTEGYGRFVPIINVIALVAKNWDAITAAIRRAFEWLKQFASKAAGLAKWITPGGAATEIARRISAKRAAGGPVNAGRSYLVGERGPELFVPRASGNIMPNSALAAAAPITINFSPTIAGNGTDVRGALSMSIRELETMIRRVLTDQQRRGLA